MRWGGGAQSLVGAAHTPGKAGGKGILGGGRNKDRGQAPDLHGRRDVLGAWCPDGAQASGSGALTSLNSWIWACSNMEKTLEEPRWACLVAAALLRVPAFLLACNTTGGDGSSPQLPKDSLPSTTLEHSRENRGPGSWFSTWRPPLWAQHRHSTGSTPPAQRTAPGSPPAWSPPPGTHHPLSLQRPGCLKGPTAPFMSQPYHLERQIRTGGEDRPKLGSLCLGWGKTGPPSGFQPRSQRPSGPRQTCDMQCPPVLALPSAPPPERRAGSQLSLLQG